MKLMIKNFRSVKEQKIELPPITLVYGANGAGKSSLLYALLTLKNIILNSNQNPGGFFNYSFVNLGGFDAVVFDHRMHNAIELGITLEKDGLVLTYQIEIGENKGNFTLAIQGRDDFKAEIQLPVSFPYPANQQTEQPISHNQPPPVVTWNGITAQVQPGVLKQEEASRLAASLNAPVEMLRRVGIVPLKRGFSKPYYSSTPVSPMMTTEDEVATFLSTDKYLVSKMSGPSKRILNNK